jgi:propanol-preferring alcohol dehydrogenase
VRPGERVCLHYNITCGDCDYCNTGNDQFCAGVTMLGHYTNGGYAEYIAVPARNAIPLPDEIPFEQGATLMCASATSFHALRKSRLKAGETAAVFGVGGLGHLAVQIANAWGAEVIALDVDASKLALAKELGAARTLNAADAEDIKALRKLGGVHVAVVTSASKAAYDTAFKCLRPGGTLSVVGLPSEPLTFAALGLVGIEARVVGSSVGTRDDMRAVLQLAAEGKLRCHTETQPLDQVNAVFERMRRGQISGRVVLTCGHHHTG